MAIIVRRKSMSRFSGIFNAFDKLNIGLNIFVRLIIGKCLVCDKIEAWVAKPKPCTEEEILKASTLKVGYYEF